MPRPARPVGEVQQWEPTQRARLRGEVGGLWRGGGLQMPTLGTCLNVPPMLFYRVVPVA